MDSDIPARDHTVNGSKCLTEDDVRAYLTAEGYAAEAEAMITGALKFPEIYRYTGGPARLPRARPAARRRMVLAGRGLRGVGGADQGARPWPPRRACPRRVHGGRRHWH